MYKMLKDNTKNKVALVIEIFHPKKLGIGINVVNANCSNGDEINIRKIINNTY